MKRRDLLLAVGILLLAAALWKGMDAFRERGARAVITVDGQVYGVYDLDEEQTILIGETNVCRIGNGEAVMESADCPDQICVKTRAARKKGDTIVCLPNRVVIEVTGDEEGGYDAVAG